MLVIFDIKQVLKQSVSGIFLDGCMWRKYLLFWLYIFYQLGSLIMPEVSEISNPLLFWHMSKNIPLFKWSVKWKYAKEKCKIPREQLYFKTERFIIKWNAPYSLQIKRTMVALYITWLLYRHVTLKQSENLVFPLIPFVFLLIHLKTSSLYFCLSQFTPLQQNSVDWVI